MKSSKSASSISHKNREPILTHKCSPPIYSAEVYLCLDANTLMYSCRIGASLKVFRHVINETLTFETVHKQPFPIPHYCGIRDLPGFDSATQRNDSMPENARRSHVVWIAVGTPAVDCTVEEVEIAIRE